MSVFLASSFACVLLCLLLALLALLACFACFACFGSCFSLKNAPKPKHTCQKPQAHTSPHDHFPLLHATTHNRHMHTPHFFVFEPNCEFVLHELPRGQCSHTPAAQGITKEFVGRPDDCSDECHCHTRHAASGGAQPTGACEASPRWLARRDAPSTSRLRERPRRGRLRS